MERKQKIDPYNDSQGPSMRHGTRPGDPKTVSVKSRMTEQRMAGIEGDKLFKTMKGVGERQENRHRYTHSKTPKSRGARYEPRGEYGRTKTPAFGRDRMVTVPNRMSARPSNAVGSPDGGRGGNAVGNPPNRYGENALASKFVPHAGGKKP